MEAASFSETPVSTYNITLYGNIEDHNTKHLLFIFKLLFFFFLVLIFSSSLLY
jgi:hypothetical protein